MVYLHLLKKKESEGQKNKIKSSEKEMSMNDKRTMKNLLSNFQAINNTGKYYYTETLTRGVENSDFSEFDSLKNLLLIEQNKDRKGGNLLIVFKNIAESSNNYWAHTKNSQTRAVVIADAFGGVLGTTCSGVMGILWGAGFSYAYDMCTDY